MLARFLGSSVSIPAIVLVSLFVYRAPSRAGSGITDMDYYWHLGYGEWILAHGQLPTVDFWSWTFEGHSYRLTQWLGEVAMALANHAAGTLGTSALAALLVCLTLAASYRAARCSLDNRLAALAVAICCNSVLLSLACRPHQFSHLGLAVLTWILAEYQTGRRTALYWIPPLFAVWVNLHGAYAFGLAYLGLFTLFLAVEGYATRTFAEARSLAVPLLVATCMAMLATLLNPYGWGAWEYVIEVGRLKASSAGIVDEWAATSIKSDAGLAFFLVTAAVAAAMATTRQRPAMHQVLAALALTAIGWSAVRLSVMATILMVPLLASAVRGTAFYELAFGGAARAFDRPIRVGVAMASIAAVLVISVGVSRVEQATARYMASKLPVEEVSFMKRHGLGGRILNTPEAGGYLIRELGAKVSIDTRLDLYGDRALFELLFAMRGEAGWKDYVARMGPDVILLNNPSPLRHLLADGGDYRAVFEGPAYTVLVRLGDYPELASVSLTPASRAVLDQLGS